MNEEYPSETKELVKKDKGSKKGKIIKVTEEGSGTNMGESTQSNY